MDEIYSRYSLQATHLSGQVVTLIAKEPIQNTRNIRLKHREIWAKMTSGRFAAAIAATASLLGLKLITTDADFDHLGDFIKIKKIAQKDILQFK